MSDAPPDGRVDALRDQLEQVQKAHRLRRLLEIALGILSAIGGFVDVGDLVASTETGARFGLGLARVLWRG
jgi:hypothetical protein